MTKVVRTKFVGETFRKKIENGKWLCRKFRTYVPNLEGGKERNSCEKFENKYVRIFIFLKFERFLQQIYPYKF